MTVKHHKIFQVYLPKNIGDGEGSFSPTMFIEEAYLMSNGTMTPDFKPNDQDRNPLDVVLYPSFIYASKKLFQTETEQIGFINDRIDAEFCGMLLWIKPIYRLTEFLDYHYNGYMEEKNIFLRHIKFVILPLIKKIIEHNSSSEKLIKEDYPDNSDVSEIILSWIKEKEESISPKNKMTTNAKIETKIKKAKNVIVSNDGKIDLQSNRTSYITKKGKILTIIGLIISAIMLIIALVTNWDKLFYK